MILLQNGGSGDGGGTPVELLFRGNTGDVLFASQSFDVPAQFTATTDPLSILSVDGYTITIPATGLYVLAMDNIGYRNSDSLVGDYMTFVIKDADTEERLLDRATPVLSDNSSETYAQFNGGAAIINLTAGQEIVFFFNNIETAGPYDRYLYAQVSLTRIA